MIKGYRILFLSLGLLLVVSESFAEQRSRRALCAPLLYGSEDNWSVAYLGLLNLILEGIDEIVADAFGHADRAQVKSLLLQKLASSPTPTNPLDRLTTHYSPKLSTLADSGQLEIITENLTPEDWNHIRKAAQQKITELKSITEQQTIARPSTKNDFNDLPDHEGNNRLHRLIIQKKFVEALELVTSDKLSTRYLNQRNHTGYSPLQIIRNSFRYLADLEAAMKARQAQDSEELRAADVLLIKAAVDNNLAEINRLYLLGADVNVDLSARPTPLAAAIDNGHAEAIRLLIKLGANTDWKDKFIGFTPLIYSFVISNSGLEIVDALLEDKSQIEATDKYGKTPFTRAYIEGRIDIMNLLVRKGALAKITVLDITTDPVKPHMPDLEYARKFVKALVDLNVNLNDRFKNGNTLLDNAATSGSLELVTALLEYGADPKILGSGDHTPRDHCQRMFLISRKAVYIKIIELLEKYK